MKVSEAMKDVADRVGIELTNPMKSGDTFRDYILRIFNFYYQDFNNRYNWPWRLKIRNLQSVRNYITGSVTVTNASRTVTGSGVAWTSSMIGRYLKLDRDNEIYQILNVSGSTITLTQPYVGNDGSGLNYLIWAKFIDLDPDVPFLADIHLSEWPHTVSELPIKEFEGNFIKAYSQGSPLAYTWGNFNRRILTYSEGTITGSEGGLTLTGTGTGWLDNVFAGTRIAIGVFEYNIETVDSDTQITLVQRLQAPVSNASYVATTKNRGQIALSTVPNPAKNLYIRYYKKTYSLIDDDDETEIWEGCDHPLTNVVYAYVQEKLTQENSFNWLTVYESQIKKVWAGLNEKISTEQVPRIKNRTVNTGGLEGGYRYG